MEFSTTAESVLFYIACISTSIFSLKIILMSLGGSLHHDPSFASDAGHSDGDFGVFSINSILCFFMGAGWIGLASLREWGISFELTIIYSLIGGIFCTLLFIACLYYAKKLNHDVKPFTTKIGEIGTVYRKINAYGIGQVIIRNKIIKATANTPIDSFKSIRVLEDKEIDTQTVVKVEIV